MLHRNTGHPEGEGQTIIPADEARLVAAAKAGDAAAFTALVEAAQGEVYTLAYRLTGNEEDAKDVTQEAFLRAYRSLKRFRGDALFSTWMYRITANCASTCLTRRARAKHVELSEDDEFLDERPEADPEVMAEAGALRDRVTAALAELPPILRAVVVLRDVYDLPHDAIAAELGITESAAKVRLHRARRKLKELLISGPKTAKAIMNDGQWEVLALKVGRTDKEVAAIIGITPAAVAQRRHRAKRALERQNALKEAMGG